MPVSIEAGLYREPPYRLLNAQGRSPVLLVCEHASRYIPAELQQLGLDDAAAQEHIAWDIGALALAEALSARLDAPLLAAGYSRLLIDLNRPLAAPDSIPEHSEIYPIPGNCKLDAATRAQRQAAIFEPFHRRLGELIDQRLAAGVPLRLVGVHSFTPSYRGVPRPWSAGVLFDRAAGYAERIIAGLRQGDEAIGANQPYQIDPAEDMTVPVHGDERGLDAVLIEIRNDGLRTPEAVAAWAERLAPWL
ncbi:N-formylglutamate amidohydrolase [Pseudomonas panipatensis]|uniref:Predicted N-formylglutamate amidohydrolase n=1 Tax=Pseudomonas panipatensis TaxID=428992 RepID=A0A1G8M3U8_9PSED|nr:N-formylglutamate amidohydrolase [Pseudomonas panipatensis]SDI62553.1 Predicted N-formylglutamate amidohydrolase [Pseudomonas panipatensis]SMP47955.1 Predicted N-formylglutamate amidohydrolase [Pseudomonas panipatensis]